MSEAKTTPWHETIVPPAYKRLPIPRDYGTWKGANLNARQRLDQYEAGRRAGTRQLDPSLERLMQRRASRREREGRLGPPPPI